MTEKKPFRKELLALAVPISLQSVLNALVGASDALMLGRLTQDAIAAVSLANQIAFILSLFTHAFIGACSSLISQYKGKNDRGGMRRLLCMAIRYAAGFSVLFSLAALIVPESMIAVFTNEPELIRIGGEYLRIVGISYALNSITGCYLMMMKIDGRAKMSVLISAVTVVVDMTADIFLIYGIGSFEGLGANGSAWSTVAVQTLCFVWVIADSLRKDRIHPDRQSLFSFSRVLEKDMWKIAVGSLASSLSWGLSISAHSFVMGHMGTDATAAASVTGVAQELTQCITQGLSAAAGIMIGGRLGAGRFEDAKTDGLKFFKVSAVGGAINVALLCIAGPLAVLFYNLEPLAQSYLIGMLIFSCFYMFAYAYNTIITVGVFPAGGDTVYDAKSVIYATWCFAMPCALIACFLLKWPVMAVYAIMCLDEIVKVPFIYPRYKKYIWLKNLTREGV